MNTENLYQVVALADAIARELSMRRCWANGLWEKY